LLHPGLPYFACAPAAPLALPPALHDALPLCTATCKPTQVVTPILEEQGLAPLIDFIAGASMDTSRDTKAGVIRYVLDQPLLQGKDRKSTRLNSSHVSNSYPVFCLLKSRRHR